MSGEGSSGDDELSRRGFFQKSGTGLAASPLLSKEDQQANRLETKARPQQISENLFLLEDTCNVYLMRHRGRGLLIDFGSGKILDYLQELGVAHIDWVLHTHHHRDQAQGDGLAVERGIPIAVPQHEREFFESAENFWRNRRIFELYDVKNDFFSLTRNVPVAALLHDYQTFRWQNISLFVQPSPGHTPGSITLVTKLDGKTLAFSGDLLHSAGKVKTLYDLQYYYAEHEGVDLSIYSLTQLAKLKPNLLCPSHGSPTSDPLPAMDELRRKLTEWHHFWYKHPPTSELEPVAVSPHLLANTETTSSFYAILSKSGKALLVDYGGASWTFFQVFTRYVSTYDRMRFVEHSLEKLQRKFGVKSFDVAIPSHMHDDHLNGFPYLAGRYKTKIWAFENLVQVLNNPRGLNVGCIFGEPIKVDRVLRDRETFEWEEYKFTIVHSPGHTNYESALFTTIDDVRVAFTGDAFFSNADKSLRHNLIYRNQVKMGDYLKSIQNILDFDPQMIAPGHGKPFPVNREKALRFQTRALEQDRFFRELIADPDPDFGIDPSWISIYPYQALARAGEESRLEIRVRNHRTRPIHLESTLILPDGWQSAPRRLSLDVAAQSEGRTEARIRVPANWSHPLSRVAISLDVMVDGQYLGQIAEAVVDVRRRGLQVYPEREP